MGMIIV